MTDFEFERDLTVSGSPDLELVKITNAKGNLQLRPSHDMDVHVHMTSDNDSLLENATLSADTKKVKITINEPHREHGFSVRVAALFNNARQQDDDVVDVVLEIPGLVDAKCELGAGNIRVAHGLGDVTVRLGAGKVHATHEGRIKIDVGTGKVDLALHSGEGHVNVGAGDATVAVPRNVKIKHQIDTGVCKRHILLEDSAAPESTGRDGDEVKLKIALGAGILTLKHTENDVI